ncbi:hypothetical protein GCM10009743_26220 [Kribbella swartbergensis]
MGGSGRSGRDEERSDEDWLRSTRGLIRRPLPPLSVTNNPRLSETIPIFSVNVVTSYVHALSALLMSPLI